MTRQTHVLGRLFNNARKALWMRRAKRFLALGRFGDAALWCEMTLELDRTFSPARELLDTVRDEALKSARSGETADAKGASLIESELDAAFWAIEAERPQEAGEHLRSALRQFLRAGGSALGSQARPSPPELMLARGQVSYINGWYRRAEEELLAARPPGFAGFEATYYLGLCALALGKNGDCRRYFGEIIGKHPLFATDRLYELLEKQE